MIKILSLKELDNLNDYILIAPSYLEVYYKQRYVNKNINVLNVRNFLSSVNLGYEKLVSQNETFVIMYEAYKNVNNKLSLYKNCVSSDFIKELIKTYDLFYKATLISNEKENDLKLIYEEYDKLLEEKGLINERKLLKKVINNNKLDGNYAFVFLEDLSDDMFDLIKKMSLDGNVVIFDCIYNEKIEKKLKKIDNHLNFSCSFNYDKEVYYKSLNDVSDEIAFISNDISKKVMEGNSYKDFLVVSNDVDKYDPYFNLFLNHSYSKKDVAGVLTSRFVNVFVKILKADFSCDVFLDMLKLNLFDVDTKMIDKLDNYIYSWDLSDQSFYLPFTLNPSGNKKGFTDDDLINLKELNKVKDSVILPIKYLLENIVGDVNKTEILRALYTYLSEEKIIDALYEKDYDGALNFVNVLDIINDNLNDKSNLDDVILSLEMMNFINTSKSNMQDEIEISNINEANVLDKKYVYVISMQDDNVPSKFNLDGLLSTCDLEKESLIDLINEHYKKQESLFKRVFRCKYVTVTYHKLGLDLSLKMPSYYLLLLNTKSESTPKLYDKNLILSDYAKLLSQSKMDSVLDEDFSKINNFNLHDLNYKVKTQEISKEVNLNPSMIESYSKCPFYYFCDRKLKLKVNEKYVFDKRQIGIFIHYVLEKIIKNDMNLITVNSLDEYVFKYAKAYLKDNNINLSNTIKYIIKKLSKNVSLIVKNIIKEKEISSFKPRYFEFKIDDDTIIKPVVIKNDDKIVKVKGIIDRVDVFEDDDNYYYTVIDYKTGDKKFRLDDVLMGLNMQMLLYLLAIKESNNLTDKKLVLSGMLYYPALIKETMSSREFNDDEKDEIIKEKLKMNGIINKDNKVMNLFGNEMGSYLAIKKRDKLNEECLFSINDFESIFNNMKKTIIKISDDLTNGDFKASPIAGRINPCSYCPFISVCKFDLKTDKKRKPLDYKNSYVLKMLEGDKDA